MLVTLADFTGEYRFDTNAITQSNYQQAIDAHELMLLREYFDEASIAKLYAVPVAAPPAAFVRRVMLPLARRFIFHRVRMGIHAAVPAQPTTQGYRIAPLDAGIIYEARRVAKELGRYCPYQTEQTFTIASDTFTITPADPNLPDIISIGDEVEVLGVGTYQVVSVSPTAIQISTTLPPGHYFAVVRTLKLLQKSNYVMI